MRVIEGYKEYDKVVNIDDFKKPKIKYKEKILPPAIKNIGKDNYEKVGNEMIQNAIDRLPSPFVLYLYLKHNKAVWDREKFGLEKDKFDLYNKYFKKRGKICVSIPERIMAKHFKVSLGTIHNWIHKLKDEGFIKIEQVKSGSGKKCKTYNIYILGGLSKTGERIYYADM